MATGDTRACPYCGASCEADWVDVGIGEIQCGPFHCVECGASEVGIHDEPRALTARERQCGWYGPGQPAGSSANTVGGVIVDHRTASELYRLGLLDAPLPRASAPTESRLDEH
jgi:hypothetical protein